ncbi:class Ib ribonucleoside-diphosphate reductase assembly flavoprotein NrdI [Paenibacillus sp. GCM10012307]|uniref:Protein NrdI n=1 Tax=Paenibacillus roseus TaxID=2798579 RepID=A0A934J9U2_9BACL|nr:class Ib ribonucleoside-diphosphate reductase assembly flavoprotein NrdI [Paenibacillus roseus]MBJ6364188.1 class Ib ribonucleoside-diphosphate reductase assembly flavoprotein NrdI [Paenibacillus roseus]
MIVAYYSITGNVRRFVRKLGLPPGRTVDIAEDGVSETLAEPFILVTPTTGFGQVPGPVAKFAKINHKWFRGVAASGNRNWGASYGKAGDVLTERYDVPLLLRFELSGTDEDVRNFNEGVAWISNLTSN